MGNVDDDVGWVSHRSYNVMTMVMNDVVDWIQLIVDWLQLRRPLVLSLMHDDEMNHSNLHSIRRYYHRRRRYQHADGDEDDAVEEGGRPRAIKGSSSSIFYLYLGKERLEGR